MLLRLVVIRELGGNENGPPLGDSVFVGDIPPVAKCRLIVLIVSARLLCAPSDSFPPPMFAHRDNRCPGNLS